MSAEQAKPTDRPGLQTITEGEFAGWKILPRDTFEWNHCGPFYSRRLPDGTIECAFKVDKRHLNGLGVVHGGVLMTFADHALFHFAQEDLRDAAGAVTATFNSEFLGAANEGDVVEARGEVTRAGGSLVFVRGILTANGKPCMAFSAALKKIKRR
ncbi:PaaI family thioesterase [Albimonas sp. CAU 1670]|uniref:PaaI family thioesterase n=1 Tax=Albimonas sp. CAU 1670 TaxID=3032599 RepID=UPI0023DCDD75|nr:PaaI family thioesterase [Albimonas sp. CAU 1670]MDF2231388.1 PaaI family thioesterase [Albimonas sp. CAU 1670]